MTGRLETLTIDSAVLEGNALGDPARRQIPIWLPPAYDESPERRFPVVYWPDSPARERPCFRAVPGNRRSASGWRA